MPQQVRGVVARGKGAPVEILAITVADPGPAEVVVGVQACGACHTGLAYRQGGINDEFPFLLGREAWVVEDVGSWSPPRWPLWHGATPTTPPAQ